MSFHHVGEIVHVDDGAGDALRDQLVEHAIDQGAAADFDQRLGPRVGQRLHARAEARGEQHGSRDFRHAETSR